MTDLINELLKAGFTDCHKCEHCGAPLVVFPNGHPWNTWFYENNKWVHKCSK